MRRRAALVGVAAVLALAACTSHPTSGRVVAKHYEPASVYTYCQLVGKITVCSPRSDDEDWVLTLTDGEDEWDVIVDRDIYEDAEVGDTIKERES